MTNSVYYELRAAVHDRPQHGELQGNYGQGAARRLVNQQVDHRLIDTVKDRVWTRVGLVVYTLALQIEEARWPQWGNQ